MRLLSFRFRILALVLGVAIVPLVLIGIVLLRGASQSGEQLLSQRLERAAGKVGNIALICADNTGHHGAAANHEGFQYVVAFRAEGAQVIEVEPLT